MGELFDLENLPRDHFLKKRGEEEQKCSYESVSELPVLIISLKRTPKRTEKIRSRMEKAGFKPVIIWATDGQNEEEISKIEVAGDYALSKGEIGLISSWQRAAKYIVDNDLSGALILEDDAINLRDMSELPASISSLPPCDIALMHCRNFNDTVVKRKWNEEFAEMEVCGWATESIFVSKAGAKKLVKDLFIARYPVDVFFRKNEENYSIYQVVYEKSFFHQDGSFTTTVRDDGKSGEIPKFLHFIQEENLSEETKNLWRKIFPNYEEKEWTIETAKKLNPDMNWSGYRRVGKEAELAGLSALKSFGGVLAWDKKPGDDLVEIVNSAAGVAAEGKDDYRMVATIKGYWIIDDISKRGERTFWFDRSGHPIYRDGQVVAQNFWDEACFLLHKNFWVEEGIPKIIHRVWVGGQMPIEFVRYGESWRENMPDWTMKEWGIKDLEKEFPEWNWNEFSNGAEASDVARLLIIEKFGGLYVDCDFECFKGVGELVKGFDLVISRENGSHGNIVNGFFAAIPNHPVISNTIKEGREKRIGSPIGVAILEIFGLRCLGRNLENYVKNERFSDFQIGNKRGGAKTKNRVVIFDSWILFPYSYSEAPLVTEECYAAHHWDRSWWGLEWFSWLGENPQYQLTERNRQTIEKLLATKEGRDRAVWELGEEWLIQFETIVDIAVAITTRNRKAVFEKTIAQIRKFTPNAKIFVVDDCSDENIKSDYRFDFNAGIAKSKNRCLELMMEKTTADHFFLFDDDTFPISENWWKPYVDSKEEHLLYLRPEVVGNTGSFFFERGKCSPNGCMMYVTRRVIELVGGFDKVFGRYGWEHVSWSDRIYNSGITKERYGYITEQQCLIKNLETNVEIQSSLKNDEWAAAYHRSRGMELFRQNHNVPARFVEYRDRENHVLTSCYKDGEREMIKPMMQSCFGERMFVMSNYPMEQGVIVEPIFATKFQRWYDYLNWINKNPKIEKVWLIDYSNSLKLRDCWDMKPGILYVGSKPQEIGLNWGFEEYPPARDWMIQNRRKILLNPGIVGGDRDVIVKFLEKMIEAHERAWEDEVEPLEDECFFNKVVYENFSFETGVLVHTEYGKGNTTHPCSWWKQS